MPKSVNAATDGPRMRKAYSFLATVASRDELPEGP